METFTLLEFLSAVSTSFFAGVGLGHYFGSSKNLSLLPMRCQTLINYAISFADGRNIKVKPVNVEAINGRNKRCDCQYIEPDKRCSISKKRCTFF